MSTDWRFHGRTAVAAAAAILALALTAVLLLEGGPGKASAATIDPADLSLNLSDSPDPVSTGSTLTYAIKIHNAGPDDATNTSVTNSLPGGVSFVTASASGGGTCKKTGNKNVCDLGTVTTTADRTVTIKVAVTKKTGSITDSASVGSDVTDPAPPTTWIARRPRSPSHRSRSSARAKP